ncbi:hypothetical protein D3C83_187570 [compost metagenome]
MREVRRYLETNEAVATIEPVEQRAKDISRELDVLRRYRLVDVSNARALSR